MLLTKRRQRQAIRNCISNIDPGIDPQLLSDDYYYLYEVVIDLKTKNFDETHIILDLTKVGMQEEDLAGEITEIIRLSPADNRRQYLTLRDIGQNLPEVTWFWPGWIPRGFLTCLAAEPGVGKTNMALDLSKRVIHRLVAPDQRQVLNIRSGKVIYVEAENFLSGLFERAEAWQINMDHLVIFPQTDGFASGDSDEQPEPLNLANPDIQTELTEMTSDLHPDLIIIDSFSSINVKGENAIEDTRDVLHFFGWLSVRFNCAVVLLHHLRKPQKESRYNRVTQHDLRGSSHIVAMSRSIIGMWVTTLDQNGPRRIEVIKANLAPAPPPLALRYTNGQGDLFDMLFDPLSEPDLPDTLTGECAEWLKETLADEGDMRYGDLKLLANKAGYSENTLQRARKSLDWQVVDTIGPKAQGNKWSLVAVQPGSVETETENHTCTHAACVTGGGGFERGGGVTHAHVLHVLRGSNGVLRSKTCQNGYFPPKYHPLPVRQLFTRSRPAPRPTLQQWPVICGQGGAR